ncbi:hypothetical protein ACERNI_10265 [Camelimonas sp. ID_303_24]
MAALAAPVLLASGWPAGAAAPTLMPGAAQIIATGTFTQGARRGGQGNGSFRKDEIEGLAEYGLLDGLTILFSPRLAVQSVSRFASVAAGDDVTLAAGRRVEAGGSARLGFRARLLQGARDVVSLELSGRGGALASDIASPVMRRAAEVEARLLWLRQFHLVGKPWFIDVQAGYRHFFEAATRWEAGRSDGEAVFDATLGVHLTPRLMLMLQNFSTFPVGGSGAPGGRSGSSHKAQASLAWKLSPVWTLQAGVLGTWAGGASWRERGIVVGVWRRFGG